MDKNKPKDLPAHVAIIMDGNGRWARRRGLPRFFGHRQGVEALKRTVRYSSNLGIGTLTVYAFSTENWQRPRQEVEFLLELMHKTFVREIDELMEEGVRIILIGDRRDLSAQILEIWNRAERLTEQNEGLTLNVAFNYGGRQELVSATRSIAQEVLRGELAVEQISEESISRHLYTNRSPEPDLIIRTGGELRLSNFLLWQAAYSEFYVTDVLWPDFSEQDFAQALKAYNERERRFGQVSGKE